MRLISRSRLPELWHSVAERVSPRSGNQIIQSLMKATAEPESAGLVSTPPPSAAAAATAIDPWDASAHELLAMMSRKDAAPLLASDALTVLYRRFSPRLWGAARRYEYLGPDYDAEAVLNQTFLRAYHRAHTFQCDPGPDREVQEQRVLIWLFKIQKNLIRDQQREIFSRRQDARAAQHHALARQLKPVPGCGMEVLRQFRATLSEKEAEILLTSGKHCNLASGMCELPREVRVALCQKYRLTEENLRVIRTRLVARLKNFIQSRQNPPTPTTL